MNEHIIPECDLENPYSILNLKPESTQDEIKKAYHVLVKAYHPDNIMHVKSLTPDDVSKCKNFLEIVTEAYHTLMSTQKRKEYDSYGIFLEKFGSTSVQNAENKLTSMFFQKIFDIYSKGVGDIFDQIRLELLEEIESEFKTSIGAARDEGNKIQEVLDRLVCDENKKDFLKKSLTLRAEDLQGQIKNIEELIRVNEYIRFIAQRYSMSGPVPNKSDDFPTTGFLTGFKLENKNV